MDLDSTNGTFINDKRLRPGVVAVVSPGSFITFGTCSLNSSLHCYCYRCNLKNMLQVEDNN